MSAEKPEHVFIEKSQNFLVVYESQDRRRVLLIKPNPEAVGSGLRPSDGEMLHVFIADIGLDYYQHLACSAPDDKGQFVFELPQSLPEQGLIFIKTSTGGVQQEISRLRFGRSDEEVAATDHLPRELPPPCAGEQEASSHIRNLGPGFTIGVLDNEVVASRKSQILFSIERWNMPTRELRAIYQQPGFASVFNLETKEILSARVFQMTPTEIEVSRHSGHELDDIPGVDGIHLWNGVSVVGELSVHVTLPSPGRYRLWLELASNGVRASVPFEITAH